MLTVARKRRNTPKRLSAGDSLRFVRSVMEYLPRDAHGRTKKLAAIIGCSLRTARTILNTEPSKLPRLRKLYLQRSAANLNVPASKLIARKLPPPGMERMLEVVSNYDLPFLDRFREMAAVVTSMTARCMFGFDMPASYHVEYNSKFEPMSIHLRFRKKSCSVLHEISIVPDPYEKWRMIYNHEKFGPRFSGVVSDDNLDRILNFVQQKTK
jgi:hypothetical protein